MVHIESHRVFQNESFAFSKLHTLAPRSSVSRQVVNLKGVEDDLGDIPEGLHGDLGLALEKFGVPNHRNGSKEPWQRWRVPSFFFCGK